MSTFSYSSVIYEGKGKGFGLPGLKNHRCLLGAQMMRLTLAEQIAIVHTIRRYFGEDVKIWLYGPRLDWISTKREVDLYVESSLETVYHRRAKMGSTNELARLFITRIDISSKSTTDDPNPESWLYIQAKQFGKRLY